MAKMNVFRIHPYAFHNETLFMYVNIHFLRIHCMYVRIHIFVHKNEQDESIKYKLIKED